MNHYKNRNVCQMGWITKKCEKNTGLLYSWELNGRKETLIMITKTVKLYFML